jgi:hypothetical protein
VISVFIGYFISTAVVTKAPQAEGGGGCPNITCSSYPECEKYICNNMYGRYDLENKKCTWATCGDTNQCIDKYCCESETGQQSNSQCFKDGIYTDNKYLCAPK